MIEIEENKLKYEKVKKENRDMKKKMEEMNLRINLQEEIKENEYNKKLKEKVKEKNVFVEEKLDI